MASHWYHQGRKKIRNIWLWLGCCCLLPTCCLHWPFTSVTVQVPLRCSTTTVQVWQYKYHHCCSTTTIQVSPLSFIYHSPSITTVVHLPQSKYDSTSITTAVQLPQYHYCHSTTTVLMLLNYQVLMLFNYHRTGITLQVSLVPFNYHSTSNAS